MYLHGGLCDCVPVWWTVTVCLCGGLCACVVDCDCVPVWGTD